MPAPKENLQRAKGLIEARYSEPLDVGALARSAQLSPAHFSREFRRAYGQPPHQYLIRKRMERAAVLVRASDRSVAEICRSVGLHSVGSFTSRFGETFGSRPRPTARPRGNAPPRIGRPPSIPLGRARRRTRCVPVASDRVFPRAGGWMSMSRALAVAEPRAPAAPSDPALDAGATRKWAVIAVGVLAGVAISVLWSFEFVDSTIGDNVANNLLGYDAKARAIDGTGVGVAFAFISGLAGSFTACNIAGFSAIAPLACQRRAMGDVLRPLGWLTAGACAVAGTYGAVGALIGTHIPQLSDAMAGDMPVRLLQSVVVFGVIGLVLIGLGLTTLGVTGDPLRGLYARHPRAQVVIMGGLIGGFLIGRPFPLFHKLFAYAAADHNALFGAGAFILQTLGNILVMAVLFLVLSYAGGGAFPRWLQAKPGRTTRITAGALVIAGTFTFAYWVLRVPAAFGIGWWPSMPWS
jgi:AraC-like DNA-binding protein